MKTYVALFASALMTSTVFAAGNVTKNKMDCESCACCHSAKQKKTAKADPLAEERFRMKYGRNTPAEELRLARNRKEADAKVLASADRMTCEPGCC